MAKLVKLEASKTYATEANAIKAAEKLYGNDKEPRYFVQRSDDGRFFPVFIGLTAIQRGVHFKFACVA